MLSYLHSYHAGSRTDVHKHQALVALLRHLTTKPRPITYMETHAGRGLYDLAGDEAKKTGEAWAGIRRLQAAARKKGSRSSADPGPHLGAYLDVVEAARTRHGATFYPGSPWIARHLLRDGDALHLMELHPVEYPALKRWMRGTGAHVHNRDGYEGVLALSPPTPRRGMVLIDPSFEIKDEYMEVAKFIPALHRKWPEAVVLLWYPVLAADRHKPMLAALAKAGLPDTEVHEIAFPANTEGDEMTHKGLLGSGLYILNRPFGYTLSAVAGDA